MKFAEYVVWILPCKHRKCGEKFTTIPDVYRSLHGLAPQYVTDDLHRAGDIPSRQRLRSVSSLQPEVQYTDKLPW